MGLYYNLKKSLVRNLVDFSLSQLPDGSGTAFPVSPTSKQTFYRTDLEKLYRYDLGWKELDIDFFFFDLDAHAVEQSLPAQASVVLKGFSMVADERIVTADFMVGVMIPNDSNLNKHDRVLDALFNMFLPTKYLKVWSMVDGSEIGNLQVENGVEVLPMHKADQRPLQFIGVSMVSNITANLVSQ